MLSDHDLAMLRDIERRLRAESPSLARLLNSVETRSATGQRKRARMRALGAAAAFAGLAFLGPRMLSEAEVRAQRRPPLPRRVLCDSSAEMRDGRAPESVAGAMARSTVDPCLAASGGMSHGPVMAAGQHPDPLRGVTINR